MNFIKYHFQDESLFVDNVKYEASYQTSCLDNVNNVYIALDVKQSEGKIAVTDKTMKLRKLLSLTTWWLATLI